MTARPPLETLDASSEGSSESLETGTAQASKEGGDAGEAKAAGKLNRTEPSISRTLEAILSKSDADDDLSVPDEDDNEPIGTRTLMGMGASGLPLPPRPPAKPSLLPADDEEQTFSVEDVFDDEGTAVSSIKPNGKGRGAKGGDDQVGDLLDEVADALNVEASTYDSTVGALPGRPVPPARPIRADVAPPKDDEFEFEDPDDGPTTLNAGGVDDDSEDVDVGTSDEDEAVVLGPAKLPPSRSIPALPGRLPPPAGAAAAPAVAAPAAGVSRATPFAGMPATLPSFPAPVAGRSRLPTPAPGQAIGLPPPGRAGLPGGTPVNGVPSAPTQGDSSRRSTSGRTGVLAGDKSTGHHATAAVMESLSSAVESASVVLKKDVKFRVASLVGVVVATFVVGLLIGRAVIGSGKKTTAEASETVAVDEAKAPVAPVKAEVPAAPAVAAPAPTPAAPPAAEAAPPPAAPVAEAPPPAAAPIHKRRARRANLVAKEDNLPKPSPKAISARPVTAKPVAARPAAKAAPAAPKKKSAWHDPFAD